MIFSFRFLFPKIVNVCKKVSRMTSKRKRKRRRKTKVRKTKTKKLNNKEELERDKRPSLT